MRIICFGDVHMSLGKFQDIPGIGSADAVIINGDLTNFGSADDARKIIDCVKDVNQTVYAQIGNLDNMDVNDYLQEIGINLHGQAILLDGQCCLIGAGGSNIAPFNYPVDFSEAEISALLDTAYFQAKELISTVDNSDMPLILVVHMPPFGTEVDRLHDGTHVGSSAVRQFIENIQPAVCLAGHIHEARGEDIIGSTPVINPGMISKGGWIDVTVEGSTVTASLK